MAKKKWAPTKEQIENDPSLRWVPYRNGEAVWSDTYNREVRFLRYEGEFIRLATLNGISPLPDLVPQNTVRRLTTCSWYKPEFACLR